jgi:muramoyltetrapeptide carboxypeptidase
MAGGDKERAADLNTAIHDPEVRAILTLRGGCGSLRLLADVDTGALRADPKPIIGFSDITALHQVWHQAGVSSVHGAVAGTRASTVRQLLVGERGAPVRSDSAQFGAALTTTGTASGPFYGGNIEMLARSVGVVDNDLEGHVLLLETQREVGLGMVDRALTQLLLSGALAGVSGVAVGTLEGFEDYQDREWTVLDVLHDRLGLARSAHSGRAAARAPREPGIRPARRRMCARRRRRDLDRRPVDHLTCHPCAPVAGTLAPT